MNEKFRRNLAIYAGRLTSLKSRSKSHDWETTDSFGTLAGKSLGKQAFQRTRRLDNNINIDHSKLDLLDGNSYEFLIDHGRFLPYSFQFVINIVPFEVHNPCAWERVVKCTDICVSVVCYCLVLLEYI